MLCSRILLAGLLPLASLFAQPQGVASHISPIPLWPADGVLSPEKANESLFYSPETEQLVVITDEARASGEAIRFDLRSKAVAEVAASVTQSGEAFVYSYQIANSPKSVGRLQAWSLLLPADSQMRASARPPWSVVRESTPRQDRFAAQNVSLDFIHFSTLAETSLAPGAGASGFSVVSRYRPGYASAFSKSLAENPLSESNLGALPPDLRDKIRSLIGPDLDGKMDLALSPRYNVDTPLEAVAAGLHNAITRFIGRKSLSATSPFVKAALDELLKQFTNAPERAVSGDQFAFLDSAETAKEREIATVIRFSVLPSLIQ